MPSLWRRWQIFGEARQPHPSMRVCMLGDAQHVVLLSCSIPLSSPSTRWGELNPMICNLQACNPNKEAPGEEGSVLLDDSGSHVVVLFVPSPDYGRRASPACCSSSRAC